MTRFDFLSYNDRPCKFRLRTGKDVFGVIWETKVSGIYSYHFASQGERFTLQTNSGLVGNNVTGQQINLEDIIHAEPLPREALSA